MKPENSVSSRDSGLAATLKNICDTPPGVDPKATAGRYLRAPSIEGRVAEGGLRLQGRFKRSQPGKPLVTIITVCWNSTKTIEKTFESVFSQTYDNIEYIVVDAASTDGTVDLLNTYSDRIDYFVSEPDRGLYHAMNKGLELASGDSILILNSDDWYRNDCVEALVHAKDHSCAHFVSALAQYVDDAGTLKHVLRHMPFDESCRIRMPLRHETMLVPKEVYNDIGPYDERFRIIADFHLVRRLFDAGYTLFEVQEPLLFFSMGGVSHTDRGGLFQERVEVVHERFPFLTSEDAEAFAELTKLTPNDLDSMLRRYPDEADFHDTIYRYYVDRRKVSADWREGAPKSLFKQSERPLVSVVIAVYNAETTIRKCLNSVLNQSFDQIEILCINDKTPCGSQAIIDDYAKRDSRVRPLNNPKNIGLGATRNHGVRVARGDYIFHLDPDDTIPRDALEKLFETATRNNSELVKGAYLSEQIIHGEGGASQRKSLCPKTGPVINTNLRNFPKLMTTTEGHWSYIYQSEFARRVPYPSDLKMGQDSIYLCNVLIHAKKISIIDDLVYYYRVNAQSAMNTFNFRQYRDGIEWRRRSYVALSRAGFPLHAERMLKRYWGDVFFRSMVQKVSAEEFLELAEQIQQAFIRSGDASVPDDLPPFLKQVFTLLVNGEFAEAHAYLDGPQDISSAVKRLSKPGMEPDAEKNLSMKVGGDRTAPLPLNSARASQKKEHSLRIATISTFDSGGAGIGTQRRVAALRKNGVDAHIYSLITKTDHSYVHQIKPQGAEKSAAKADSGKPENPWRAVQEKLIQPVSALPGFKARELFSLAGTVVSFSDMKDAIDQADVVHLHWTVGMFGYDDVEILADKPVVWTFADQNPITGGCHYSEGCEGYKRECWNCPLSGGSRDLANKQWRKKKAAYAKIKNLQIICPSKWLADCVRESSLLGDRPVHHIPNAFPTNTFKPTNKTVARIRSGLPLNRKLLIFGADNLANKRKGGDLLQQALDRLQSKNELGNIEVITFGGHNLKLPVRTHSMGRVVDPARLASIYSAADAFIFPSREDNAPLTVGEAMLCGTPVVAYPVGNVPELIEHKSTGYLAEPFSPNSLAEGIEWVVRNEPGHRHLTRQLNCRLKAVQYHDPDVAAKRHIEVYNFALKRTELGPEICIVTPCFNMVDTIDETIESVVSQRGDFTVRYHVQDGGSYDGTVSKLQAWENKLACETDGAVHFSWSSKKDKGMYDAIKLGIEAADPVADQFVGWINADDILLPGAFAKLAALARQRPDIAWVGSHTYNLLESGEIYCSRKNPTPTVVIREGLCDGEKRHWHHLQQEGTFFKKHMWDRCEHVFANYRYAGDWALWRELAMHTEYFQCDTPLGAFRIREGQLSGAMRGKYDQEIEDCVSMKKRDEAFRDLYDKRRSLSANVVFFTDDDQVNVREEETYVRDRFYQANQNFSVDA